MSRRLSLITLALAALAVTPAPARAEPQLDRSVNRYFGACDNATGSTPEITGCLEAQYKRADEELNAAWPHVLRLIDSSEQMPPEARRQWRDSLMTAQRAWVAYKEAECLGAAPFKYYQGTQASIESLACLIRVTALRLEELKDYLQYRR